MPKPKASSHVEFKHNGGSETVTGKVSQRTPKRLDKSDLIEAVRTVKIKINKPTWDFFLAGPFEPEGNDVYKVSGLTLKVLDEKGIQYQKVH